MGANVLHKKPLEMDGTTLCSARITVKSVEAWVQIFNAHNEHTELCELHSGEEVNFSLETWGMEGMIARVRVGLHAVEIVSRRCHIVRHPKSKRRNHPLPGHFRFGTSPGDF